jgi:predicted AlkP superfamily phosphohydrolase/phosphomutase
VTNKPKKTVIIGLDCALPNLVERHIAEGHLPTFKKLIDNGVFTENGLVPYPTITPPNWATIATGAWPGTHGICYFHVHEKGTSPLDINTVSAFSSDRVNAEYLWDTLDKIGKKSIVLNYPGSWPSNLKNGVMIGGAGLSIAENRDGLSGLRSVDNLCMDMLVTTGIFPMSICGKFQEEEGWKNIEEPGDEPLAMEAELNFPDAQYEPAPTTWHVLVTESGNQGYDRVTLSPTRDMHDAFFTIKPGEWSRKIFTTIKMKDGSETDVFFRCKLLELSEDAEDFRLFISALNAVDGWSSPPEIARRIKSEEGIFSPSGGLKGFVIGWFDLDTYVEINNFYSIYLADAAAYLMQNSEWDLFAMHSHPPDWLYHAIITDMDEQICQDENKLKAAWDTHLKVYEAQDRMIAQILEAAGEDVLVVLVSDHGATPDGPVFNPYDALVPAGLCSEPHAVEEPMIKEEDSKRMGAIITKVTTPIMSPDLSLSKALPQRSLYVYVNLKGRDPEGIVEPEDYTKVQQQIIDALYNYVDPETGKRPVALALSKQDARLLGLYGDDVGDVVYAIYPEFGSQHGSILPTAEYGVGTLKSLFTFTGPGIKKGFRLERTAWITDLVPTICYLMNWPVPEHTEGAVLYQIFENPNFRFEE